MASVQILNRSRSSAGMPSIIVIIREGSGSATSSMMSNDPRLLDAFQQLVEHFLDCRSHQLDAPRSEGFVDQPAQAIVPRRVGEEHPVAQDRTQGSELVRAYRRAADS